MDTKTALQLIEPLVTGLVTLAAAFAGSWYAFRLSDSAKARSTVRAQVAAVNKGQFVLIQQVNTLKLVQSQTIEPARQHPGRFLEVWTARSLLALLRGF